MTDLEIEIYNRGWKDGYREGARDFESRHACLMAQMESLMKALSEVDILKPRIFVIDPAVLPGDGRKS
jgi:hypothetical protein